MASKELMNSWNKIDHEGSIQPPLSETEVDALSQYNVYPETVIKYTKDRTDIARVALIACSHIRIPEDPSRPQAAELTAQAMAAFK